MNARMVKGYATYTQQRLRMAVLAALYSAGIMFILFG